MIMDYRLVEIVSYPKCCANLSYKGHGICVCVSVNVNVTLFKFVVHNVIDSLPQNVGAFH